MLEGRKGLHPHVPFLENLCKVQEVRFQREVKDHKQMGLK